MLLIQPDASFCINDLFNCNRLAALTALELVLDIIVPPDPTDKLDNGLTEKVVAVAELLTTVHVPLYPDTLTPLTIIVLPLLNGAVPAALLA